MEGAVNMSTVTGSLTSSFTEVGNGLLELIGDVLPIALPVVGATLVIGLGIKIFKSVVKK